MPNLVSAHLIRKSVAERTLFKDLSFGIESGDKIGLIGPNGVGKSTLLRILTKQTDIDSGTLAFGQGIRFACLEQAPSFQPGHTLLEVLLEKTEDPWDGETLAKAYALISKLGFQEAGFDESSPIDSFSGGWAKRAALGRELMTDPTLLLLDEPTNHLDVESIEWLEETVRDLRCTTLTVTHDRYFLNHVSNVIWELDPRNPGGLLVVRGDYAAYAQIRDDLIESQRREEQKLQNTLRRETEWLRREAAARTTKQKARITRAEKLIERVDNVENRNRVTERSVSIQFQTIEGGPKRLIEGRAIGKRYGDRQIFKNLNITLRAGTKIGLLGRNGAGKSTLLRVLLGEEEPDSGERLDAENLKVAYFQQKRESLNPELTVLKTLCPEGDYVKLGGKYIHIRSYLERFLFSDDFARKKVGLLSGGEQARLLIAQLMLQEANLLVLDEPTNDLDLVTLSVLEESLRDFPGAVLVVSHDRYFLDQVCTNFYALGDGEAIELASLEQWKQLRDERAAAPAVARAVPSNVSPATTPKAKKLSYKDQRELEGMEATIRVAEAELKNLENESQSPRNAGRSREFFDKLAAAQSKVEKLYARWSELEALTK